MERTTKYILKSFYALLLLLIIGCDKEAESEGPMLSNLYGKLSVTESLVLNDDSLSFASNERLFFDAKFSRITDWVIKIEGVQSGASKIISGKSSELNSSNSSWMGDASQLPSFQQEKCHITLYFPGEKDSIKDSVVVISPKNVKGVLLSDFNFINSSWAIDYSADGCSISSKNIYSGAHNKSYLNLSGTDKNGDTYIGSVGIPSKTLTPSSPHFSVASDAQKTFFNVMIYGVQKTSTLLTIQFREDEGSNDGIFDGTKEDLYAYQLKVDWTGWKLITINYNDPKLTFLTYAGAPGTNGNKIREPKNIVQVDFILLTDPAKGSASVGIDLPVFTENEPYQP